MLSGHVWTFSYRFSAVTITSATALALGRLSLRLGSSRLRCAAQRAPGRRTARAVGRKTECVLAMARNPCRDSPPRVLGRDLRRRKTDVKPPPASAGLQPPSA